MNRIALLVPARNAVAVIGRLLRSAVEQSTPFDEICIYDDASTDGTSDAARRFGARVVRSETRTGPSAGKNRLARTTTCEWVHFHDADDELAPGFVERARRWIQEAEFDALLFATEDRDDATGAVLGGARWDDRALQEDPTRYHLMHTVTNCGVFRRDQFLAVGGFDTDPAIQYNEDQAMHVRMSLAGLRYRAEPEVGVIIYRRQGSMSTSRPLECARAQIEVLDRAARAVGEQYRDEIGARMWRLAAVCGGFGDWAFADRCLAVAARLGYRDPKEEHWAIRVLAALNAAMAVRVRESLIRRFKPELRKDVPAARDERVAGVAR